MLFGQKAGAALAEAHRAPAAAGLHLAHHEEDKADNQKDRQDGEDQRCKRVLAAVSVHAEGHAIVFQELLGGHVERPQLADHGPAIGRGDDQALVAKRRIRDLALFHQFINA